MINEALTCLAKELNGYLKNKQMLGSESEEKVLLSGLVNQSGQIAIKDENTIVITLVNIEEEPVSRTDSLVSNRTAVNMPDPVCINLYILFSAYFSRSNYEESLKFLSLVVSFLQEKNVFTPSNTPGLDPKIDKLSVEMVNLSTEELNNLWATLGTKYIPSVFYKLRMLTFDSADLTFAKPSLGLWLY